MTQKRGELQLTVPTFKNEVVLHRFFLTGDLWWVRVYLGGEDYRFYKLSTSDPQQLALQKWEACMESRERNADNTLTITRLFWLFIQSEQELMDRGRIDQKTFASKKSGIVNGILPSSPLRDSRVLRRYWPTMSSGTTQSFVRTRGRQTPPSTTKSRPSERPSGG